jgi:YwqJ-like deaminase
MGGEITKALGQAAQRVGKSLGKDAGNAVKKLYGDSREKLEGIMKRSTEADATKADEITKIAGDMKTNAEKDATTVAQQAEKAATQTALHKKLSTLLGDDTDNVPHDLENEHLPSHTLEPPEGQDKVPWIGNNKLDGSKIGHLPESAVTRDEASGLITHVNGEPVNDYLSKLSHERRGMYEDARAAGTFSKGQTGAATAVGIDRRTGDVFEGYNGRPGEDLIPDDDVHPEIGERVEAMHDPGGYTGPNKEPLDYPGHDEPLGHAEVKAANGMLNARDAENTLRAQRGDAPLPTGDAALKEMSFAPQFPGAKHNPEARTCPNCTKILDGTELPYGVRVDYTS